VTRFRLAIVAAAVNTFAIVGVAQSRRLAMDAGGLRHNRSLQGEVWQDIESWLDRTLSAAAVAR
jgi:hypothetical protein